MNGRPLPAPLPPEKRTVGQLVAEAIRLYGHHIWRALPLGLPLAVADSLSLRRTIEESILILCVAAPAFTAAYIAASALVGGVSPSRRTLLRALAVGTLVFLPAAVFFPWFAILSVALLALTGLSVPVIVIEDASPRAALRRAVTLCRGDYPHALGSLAALVIVFALTRFVLVFLLREQADNAVRAAVFLADLVISPLLFLGAALLYVDQAARVRSSPLSRSAS